MEDYYAHRNSSHRYAIQKIDDSGEIQLVDGNGLTDEQHTKIMRVYPHGFSSHSIEDAHMVSLGLGGRRDMIVALGGEHKDKRPKNLPKGDTILYNAEGDVIRIFGKETIDITHAKNIKLSIGQGLADSSSSSGGSSSGGASGGSGQSQGKEAKAGEDKDVTMVFTENDITITKGKAVIKLTKDNMTLTYDDTVTTMESGKITHKAPHVVIESDRVDLGAEGGMPVGLCGGGCATKVFGV
jgi:phage gp45-like